MYHLAHQLFDPYRQKTVLLLLSLQLPGKLLGLALLRHDIFVHGFDQRLELSILSLEILKIVVGECLVDLIRCFDLVLEVIVLLR